MTNFDVVVIGAGAAGLMCAGAAGQQGLRVLLLDHAAKVAEKIRISGGGRCNFTNLDVGPANFLGDNPHFCRSALAGYRPADFLDLLARHDVRWHEKHRGQLFCDGRSEDIIRVLLAECEAGQVTRRQPCGVRAVRALPAGEPDATRFELDTDEGQVRARNVVVATGGLSIPKIGATDFGHRLATQFGHHIVPLRPALVPLTFSDTDWAHFAALAGIALTVELSTPSPWAGRSGGRKGASKGSAPAAFLEDLLFTHRGLSGPAILQISSYWTPGQPITIDLRPGHDLGQALVDAKSGSRKQLATAWSQALGSEVPQRLAHTWLANQAAQAPALQAQASLAELRDKDLLTLGQSANHWTLTPQGTEGYAKAEVTAGGVDTRELSSQTMESRLQAGLHFIGEVVDVTGWLGGYNFQWAWSSAMACARALAAQQHD